jgi:hypothetical protein
MSAQQAYHQHLPPTQSRAGYTGRDGRSPNTALLGSSIQRDSNQHAYLVYQFGQWILVGAADGRQYTSLGFSVRNVDTLSQGEWVEPLQEQAVEGAFAAQITEMERLEEGDLAQREERYENGGRTRKGKRAVDRNSRRGNDGGLE